MKQYETPAADIISVVPAAEMAASTGDNLLPLSNLVPNN